MAERCCTACGVVIDESAELQNLRAELQATQELLSRTAAQLSIARGERNTETKRSSFMGPAQEVFDYWQAQLSPRAKEFSGKRLEAVLKRLEHGYTVDELKRAVDGCATRPYVTDKGRVAHGQKGERQAELELICRSPENVDRFIGYADEADHSNVIQLPQRGGQQPAMYDPLKKPLDRAVTALMREFGKDAIEVANSYGAQYLHEPDEYWAVCPLHPGAWVKGQGLALPLRLREHHFAGCHRGEGSSLDVACAHGCLPSQVLAEIRRLEEKKEEALVPLPEVAYMTSLERKELRERGQAGGQSA